MFPSPDSIAKFQSAPLTGARGDLQQKSLRVTSPVFQSAPLTGARGDKADGAQLRMLACFNPLP